MRISRTLITVVAGAIGLMSAGTQAMTVLNNASLGYYNSGIGTSLDTSGVNSPFPCANIGCGDNTVSYPSAPNLSAAAGALGSWLGSSAPSGGAWSAGSQAIPGSWAINTETAISYAISAATGLTGLNLQLGVDNGVFVWLNGNYLFGARAAGGSSLGEYSVALPNIAAGTSYLQILREDHGGATGYDIQLTGNAVVARVPEPGSISLLGVGLLGLTLALRRRAVSSIRS